MLCCVVCCGVLQMPEHLLCNEASIEAGIWRQQDCEFV